MAETSTDCRSEEGITVGLVDALISISRILAHRDMRDPAVVEAFKDLHGDNDFKAVCAAAMLTTITLPCK